MRSAPHVRTQQDRTAPRRLDRIFATHIRRSATERCRYCSSRRPPPLLRVIDVMVRLLLVEDPRIQINNPHSPHRTRFSPRMPIKNGRCWPLPQSSQGPAGTYLISFRPRSFEVVVSAVRSAHLSSDNANGKTSTIWTRRMGSNDEPLVAHQSYCRRGDYARNLRWRQRVHLNARCGVPKSPSEIVDRTWCIALKDPP